MTGGVVAIESVVAGGVAAIDPVAGGVAAMEPAVAASTDMVWKVMEGPS